MKRFFYITVLSVFSTVSFAQGGKHFSIPESVFDSIYHEVKTPYEYGYFLTGGLTDLFPPTNVPLGERLSSDPGIVGNPIVFRIPGDRKFVYMSFTYHDGIGYQTGLARSRDFVSWEAVGVMIDNTSYNHTSNWDKYHAGGYIMRDHVWGKTPYPHRAVVNGPYKGLYSMTYLGSNEPYNENGNVSQGIAFSDRIFEKDGSVAKWWRYENPILSPDEGYAYEAGACWKSEAIWDEKNNRYAIFYNASRKIPECLCQAYSKDLIHWEREPSNPVIGPEEHEGYLWGKSHSGDPDAVKIGDYWVIFYFSTTPNGIVDVFAVSTDMVHWQQSFRPLLTCNSTWSSVYAHKPCVIKQNGVVYHYYVAYGNIGYISAVNTSIDLSVLKTALAIPEGKYPQRQYKAIQKAIKKLQNSLIEENGSLESIEKAIKNLKVTLNSPPVIANPDDVVRFEVVSCEDTVLHLGMEQTRDVKYGFEGGRIVKTDGVYHWITAEMAGDPMNVNMKIAHWTSRNGTDWQRQSTLFQSDGDYTGVSQRAAVWGPMPVFMEDEDRWHLFYVCYKGKPSENGIFYANHHGVVQHAVSDVKGRNGIGGPYTDRGILMCYDGCNPDAWEGLQGTDSFFPYKVGRKWYAIYGSATTQYKNGDERRKWQVGLAQADKIEGPWTRMSELNPLNFVDFAENPIVMELQKGIYIAIVDGGPWINKPGFSLSTDGLKWTPLKHFELEPKVKKWWRTMRTPLSLIKEDDGTYTMFFTAFKDYPGQPTFGTLSKLTLKVKYAPTAK